MIFMDFPCVFNNFLHVLYEFFKKYRFLSSEHKFFPPTGMASFWTHLPKSVEIVSDVADVKENNENITDFRYLEQKEKQRCVCAHV